MEENCCESGSNGCCSNECTEMEFSEIVQKRYAAKLFDGKELPQAKVDKLLEMVRFAPSSFNIQPWAIKVVSDAETKEKLKAVSWNQPQITSCSHLLVFCADKNIKQKIGMLESSMISAGASPESIKTYMEMMWNFEKNLTEEQKLSWAQRQLYLALGNALNGAKSLGFDSCPMEGFDPKEYSKILKLPDNIIPTALCPIGYASDKPSPKLRFPKEEVLI